MIFGGYIKNELRVSSKSLELLQIKELINMFSSFMCMWLLPLFYIYYISSFLNIS